MVPNEGEPGVSLKIGQIYERTSGEVRDGLNGGVITIGKPRPRLSRRLSATQPPNRRPRPAEAMRGATGMHPPARQRGAALLILLALVSVMFIYAVVAGLNRSAADWRRRGPRRPQSRWRRRRRR